MSDRNDLELEEIRTLTFEALKNFHSGNVHWGGALQRQALIIEIACVAAEKELIPITSGSEVKDARLNENEYMLALEVISNLMIEGVLMWGFNPSNPEPPFMSLTTYGKKVIESEDIVPHDPEGYLQAFKEKIPDVDDLILTYLTESIQTFRTNNLLASSVMLGVASEAAFNILFDTFIVALTGPKKEKFEKLRNSISIKTKFDEIMKEIQRIKSELPTDVQENIDSELQGIFNLIRYQRNDTGHPTGKLVTRDEMFMSLRLFRTFCNKLYQLVHWLRENTI